MSIVIPLYNGARYLREAVDSALQQTHPYTEIIIVDDGSTDDGPRICAEYVFRGVRTITQENRGIGGARNTGIRAATGDFVAFLDSDDTWVSTKLERHLEHFADRPELGVSYSFSEFVDEEGVSMGIHQTPQLGDILPLDILCRTPIGNGSAGVFDRRVFDEIAQKVETDRGVELQVFNEEVSQSEDVECWMRIALQTDWVMEGIDESLTRYRVNSQSSSANLAAKLESWEQVIDIVSSYAETEMEEWRRPAIAYQCRHLARRAVTLRDSRLAARLFWRSVSTHPKILVEEPQRSLLTAAAVLALRLMPLAGYNAVFDAATALNETRHRRRYT